MECWPRLAATPLEPTISWGISIFVPVVSRESFVIMFPLIWCVVWSSVSSKSDALGCNRLVIKRSRVSSFDGVWCFIQMRAQHTLTHANGTTSSIVLSCPCYHLFTFLLKIIFWKIHWITRKLYTFSLLAWTCVVMTLFLPLGDVWVLLIYNLQREV